MKRAAFKKRKQEDSPPVSREYRQKRKKSEVAWHGIEPPKEIKTIKDLIAFGHTYRGSDIDVKKLQRITEPLKELDRMVGLDTTKQAILNMIMYYIQGFHRKNVDYLHMVVCGPPGCGKTTVCRIIGRILSGIGVLPTDKFNVVKRTDFVAKYLGQTSHKTEEFLKKCLGGVMFIDEAYSFAPKDTDRDSFAKEALDLLNQYLSEHKDDLVCIIAGYEEELEQTFFAMNPGLKRRFPWKFVIEPYTHKELFQIFKNMIEGIGWKFDEGAINAEFFERNKELFTFAGGDIETFITKCKFAHNRRIFGKGETRSLLTREDIEAGLTAHKIIRRIEGKEPPFGMYL